MDKQTNSDAIKYFFPLYYFTQGTMLGALTNPKNLWVQGVKTVLNSLIGIFVVYTLFVLISVLPHLVESTGKHLSIIVLALIMVWMLTRICLSWARLMYLVVQVRRSRRLA